MRSLTIYIDSHGQPTLCGGAQVLLEDHAPTMIGNPVSMITQWLPDLNNDALKVLAEVEYQGFANFDVKIDPRDNKAYFFEVNPRIGRNSFYLCAAGHNPMEVMLADLVANKRVSPVQVCEQILYSLVPNRLLKRYVKDLSLLHKVNLLIKEKKTFDPLRYRKEKSWKHRFLVELLRLNHYRKFRRYYPEATELSY